MKKKKIIYISIVSILAIFILKMNYTSREIKGEDIIFVKQYTNWANGFQHYCYYVNANGEMRYSDLSSKNEAYVDIEDLISYLQDNNNAESIGQIEKESINEYYQLSEKIFPFAGLKEESQGCDMGQINYYRILRGMLGIQTETLLYSFGDWEIINRDKDAQILADWLDEQINNISEQAKGKGRKITDNDILFIKRSISEKNINQGYYVKGNGEICVYEFETEEDSLSIKKLYSYLQEHDYGTVVEFIPREELEEKYRTLFSTNEPIEEIYKRAGRGKEILYGIGYGVFDNWSVWMLADEENGEIDIADSNAVECVEWLEEILTSLEE